MNLKKNNQNRPKGDTVRFNLVRDISKPGQVYWDSNVTLNGLFGMTRPGRARTYSTITFTDYTDLQVRFICQEINHSWYTEAKISYYISIRNRGFDSIAKVAPIIDNFRKLGGDLNKLQFLKNDLNCTN